MKLVWIRHLEHGGVVQVPESAVPIYRQSNWDALSEADVAELEKGSAQRAADAEKAMASAAVFDHPSPADVIATPEPVSEPESRPAPAPRKTASKENS